MKIAYVNYYYDDNININDYMIRYPTIHGWCKSLSDTSAEVTVYQRFNKTIAFKKNSVNYVLIEDELPNDLQFFRSPTVFHKRIIQDSPDILHINGFNYIKNARSLKKYLPTTRIVVQHHAEKNWKGLKKIFQKYLSNFADGFIFTSKEVYEFWRASNALYVKNCIEIPEASTYITKSNKKRAKKETGLTGTPILLWVGRLNKNKDPITIISGLNLLMNDFPEAKLYLIYSENKLESEVLHYINCFPKIKNSVVLLGKIDRKKMSDYYSSADYFVLGSHYESSGYSLIESIACGAIPIVTNIPSFRAITNFGEIGGLWKTGDYNSFYNIAKQVLSLTKDTESEKAITFFRKNLSYDVISHKAREFYKSLAMGS